jgi:two-component system, cell cycle sensor histidine kinase and response regulator CckA
MSFSPSSPPSDTQLDPALLDIVWHESAAGICLVNAQGRVIQANRAFAEMVGYDLSELTDLPLIRLHPMGKVMMMQGLHRAIMEGVDPSAWAGEETFLVDRKGRQLSTYTRNSRVTLPGGSPARLITTVDLSDIARLNPEATPIKQVETYTALSSSVSNNLNNLLSIILGYTALLQEGTTDSKRQQVVAEGVSGAVQRATLLVKQSLYMMRRPDPERQKTDLGRFLEGKLQILRGDIDDRPIELELSMVPELRDVPLDTMQLGDALGEMIRRLHNFDPHSARGLRTRTRSEPGEKVSERFPQADAGTYAVIELVNPGRPRNSSRPPIPTLGADQENPKYDLGLTMVERIIQAHQGFWAYEAQPGETAAYTVWLPLASNLTEQFQKESPPVAPISPKTVGGVAKVLLVDDEEGLLETMASALRKHGWEVITAHDGESAVLEFRQHQGSFDLVITDLVLPGMSGWEVFSIIREAEPKLPILIMSGHLEPKLEAAVNRSGAAGFMQKPFGMTLLLRRVQSFLSRAADE